MPLFELIEFDLVLRDHARVGGFSGRVPTSFPTVAKLEQLDADRVGVDLEFELGPDGGCEHGAVPGLVLAEFGFEEGRNLGCDLGGLAGCSAVGQSRKTVLLESVEVVEDGFAAAVEVLAEPSDGVVFGVESDDAGSQADFWGDAGGLFEGGEFGVLGFGEADESVCVSHMCRIHQGDT